MKERVGRVHRAASLLAGLLFLVLASTASALQGFVDWALQSSGQISSWEEFCAWFYDVSPAEYDAHGLQWRPAGFWNSVTPAQFAADNNQLIQTFGLPVEPLTEAKAADILALYRQGKYHAGDELALKALGVDPASASAVRVQSARPGTAGALNIQETVFSSIFSMARPAAEGAGSAEGPEQGEARDLTFAGTFGSGDAYYDQSEYKVGPTVKTYGGYLSVTKGDQFKLKATVPIVHTEFGERDLTAYGLDLNIKCRLTYEGEPESLSVGVHGGAVGYTGDKFDDYLAMGGPYLAFTRVNPARSITWSVGTLFDYFGPEKTKDTWLWAVGTQFGIRLGKKVALNPFCIYYRDLDALPGGEHDWYDVGTQLAIDFSKTWRFQVGAKLALGYQAIDKNWQVFLGSAWKF